ncbi:MULTISPECIES: sugar-phosphatase [unclassified Streptococcus]|uniref:sugar-phosphatase n=1 Tax=unclassified Streptococcus TaxID=2608887 RepID=UPI001072C8F0|nr:MULTISPECIES: sugar-phosphatase [unclassified Streptococcus]MBF0787646.1 sugar-phosphatase [Streptococcus sp. 19428wC2_LYSM12]MCQ9212219.1 sugar-phosphatase [Streptococcus sp. B01]MCQ9213549.1 sugar-phosphatase [Streptococcus sp. O1]TFV05368.1 sugar-phosphatase [Streptococcus sp. LYSM12]
MNIKLIAIDIDGTLLNSKHEITPEVYQAIQDAKQAGVKIVIATGRPISGVKRILSQLNLLDKGDYVITFNGGLVQETATENDVIKEGLSYEDYLEWEYLSRQLELPMHASLKDGLYTSNRNIGKYTIYEAQLVDSPVFYRTPEEMADKDIIKMMLVDEPEKLDAAIAQIPVALTKRFNVAKSAPFYLEITPKTVNKGEAIKQLSALLGLTLDQTMAIGDQENDRSMLEVVGTAVVMENGSPDIKKIATHITKSNDEHGVAHAIREWVLN